METTLADSLREIGYGCTSDKDRCRQTLTQLGGVREVTAPAVAQVSQVRALPIIYKKLKYLQILCIHYYLDFDTIVRALSS